MKKILFACLIGMLGIGLMSCDSKKSKLKELKESVAEMNKDLPQMVSEGFVFASIEVVDESVLATSTWDDNVIGISLEMLDSPEFRTGLKQGAITGFNSESNEDTREFVKLMQELDYPMVYRLHSTVTGKNLDIRISANELK